MRASKVLHVVLSTPLDTEVNPKANFLILYPILNDVMAVNRMRYETNLPVDPRPRTKLKVDSAE
jgi:hypothetical protein